MLVDSCPCLASLPRGIHCLHVVARTCSLYSSAQLMLGFDGDTVGAVDEVIAGRDGVLKC